MKNIFKKFVLVFTLTVGLISTSGFANNVEAQSAQEALRPDSTVALYPMINTDMVLNLDLGSEGDKVTLWQPALSGNSHVSQQSWKIEYDKARGDNVVLIRNMNDNTVLTWDYYGTRSIVSKSQNYTDRQYWIVEPTGDDFILRSYYNPNYVLTVPAAPHFNGKEMTVYPYRGDKYQIFSAYSV